MSSQTIPPANDSLGGGFAGALVLHVAIAAAVLFGGIMFHNSGENWGSTTATSGTIEATAVSAIPLPQKAPPDKDNVLMPETPTLAPIVPAKPTVEAPRPDAIPIPETPKTKPKTVADKTTPVPPPHPQITKPQPDKVQTGDAPGVNMAMSVSTVPKVGTFSVGVTDVAFGTRFAYYSAQIKQKVESQWYTSMLDAQAAGHRVSITFQVERDGTPTHIRIDAPSGDATLDQSAMHALQHIDTFGPLPDAYTGNHINVQYYFDPPARP
jgi:periplasmic protein TonB